MIRPPFWRHLGWPDQLRRAIAVFLLLAIPGATA
jgi:hypothetical protein